MTSGVVAQQFLIVTALKVLCDIQLILEISDFCYKIVTQKSLLPYQIHGIQLFAEGITAELNGNVQVIKLAISAVVCMQQQHICRACLICFAASGFWRGQFAAPIKLFIGHQRVSVNTAWWLREQCCYRLPPEMLGAVSFMRQETHVRGIRTCACTLWQINSFMILSGCNSSRTFGIYYMLLYHMRYSFCQNHHCDSNVILIKLIKFG